jgi:CRISPR-associated protein Csm3
LLDIDEDGSKLLEQVLSGMRLMELDSLGGSGSRGYGKIRFSELKLDGADLQPRFAAINPFAAVAA